MLVLWKAAKWKADFGHGAAESLVAHSSPLCRGVLQPAPSTTPHYALFSHPIHPKMQPCSHHSPKAVCTGFHVHQIPAVSNRRLKFPGIHTNLVLKKYRSEPARWCFCIAGKGLSTKICNQIVTLIWMISLTQSSPTDLCAPQKWTSYIHIK